MVLCDYLPDHDNRISDYSDDEDLMFEQDVFVLAPQGDEADEVAYYAASEASSDDFPDIVVEFDDDDVPLDQLLAMGEEEFYPFEDNHHVNLATDGVNVDQMLAELPDLGDLEERLNFWRERGAFDLHSEEPDNIVQQALVLAGLGELADAPSSNSEDELF